MSIDQIKINRKYGYAILINNFEPFLREYIANEVLLINYGKEWKIQIPPNIYYSLSRRTEDELPKNIAIDLFMEELNLLHLKDILLHGANFENASSLLNSISVEDFKLEMEKINRFRRKIAHAKSSFSNLDLLDLIESIRFISSGEAGIDFNKYLENKGYSTVKDLEIPKDFFEEYDIPNNLPPESYDFDGGFVGRDREISGLIKRIISEQDRIITITGAGGVGKSALALKIGYMFLRHEIKNYETIIWFSAKTSKLTDDGIVPLKPDIKSIDQLLKSMLNLLNSSEHENYIKNKSKINDYKEEIYRLLSNEKHLIIIDNLETIIEDEELIGFIKEIPRPSQVLITSRKGLGELERRYPLGDMLEKDAIRLFKLIAMERNKQELCALNNKNILKLVTSVKCYPLLIKWSIGQYCMGKDLEKSFHAIMSGGSVIAKFSFDDVFELFSENARLVLFSMIIVGEKPVSSYALRTLGNLNEDQLDDAIRELTIASFAYPVPREVETKIVTDYNMLELTRGFLQIKLDENTQVLEMLDARFHDLSDQIKDLEVSQSGYSQALISYGIKTIDEKVAFNNVKTAKTYEARNDIVNAEKYFKIALDAAPKLSYALTEYSKFEYSRKHYHKAIKLAKEAVDTNPKNFHAWFNYGIILKKTRRYREAIAVFQNAKRINSSYLPIYTELGRVYTFNGEFEKADKEFKKALKQEKYPNYRHLLIVRQYMSENYRRWAEEFRKRRDYERRLEKLDYAKKVIDLAVKESRGDWKIWEIYRQVYIDLGVAICGKDGYFKGKKYLENALKPINIQRKTLFVSGEKAAVTYFYLAVFANKAKLGNNQVKEYIHLGLRNCPQNCKWFSRLERLLKKVSEESLDLNFQKQYGHIQYYSEQRKFGILKSGDESYLFFKNEIKNLKISDSDELKNKYVSFQLKRNIAENSDRNPFIASNIELEKSTDSNSIIYE